VFSLHDGDAGMADLLGGKGANLGEMTRLGLSVPEGFVSARRPAGSTSLPATPPRDWATR
jgi:pyruvate,orthophosphate dikinase